MLGVLAVGGGFVRMEGASGGWMRQSSQVAIAPTIPVGDFCRPPRPVTTKVLPSVTSQRF